MTSAAAPCSPTRSNAMSTSTARTRNTAGRKTRSGNIRCPTAPISAHSCARKASNSNDRSFPELVEHEKTQRARKIAGAAAMVDLGHQGVQRQAALLGDGRKLGPERVFQRDRGAMAIDCDRTFAHRRTVAA